VSNLSSLVSRHHVNLDVDFPHLTVGETLGFAAAARAPRARSEGQTRKEYIEHVRDVVMAVFGLSHTVNTKVGNDFVRGVSGGERKRVSIAEMALAASALCCWDNATRGLDSASALDYVRALRLSSQIFETTHLVALYQASQNVYDLFHKVIVLYEGREIFFGSTLRAKQYFEEMGWHCPPRQTTADFLTSLTNPSERQPQEGHDSSVPRTAEDFEKYWKDSADYKQLHSEIHHLEQELESQGAEATFNESYRQRRAKHTLSHSPYVISIPMQVKICTARAYQRIWNDRSSTMTTIGGQIVMSLIIGSLFFGTPFGTQSFFAKSSVLFFAVLLNSLMTVSEINALYSQRPIVEKHASYAFYHPFAEALAGVISDIPIKLLSGVIFNVILYFLASLRYEAGPFFIFFLFTFISLLCMSQIFRTIAAATKSIPQALAIAGVLLLGVVIYTGFVIPRPNMHPWLGWIFWINPLAYAYEALIVNEFHGRNFPCSNVIPAYPGFSTGQGNFFICGEKGAVAGELFVNGDKYLDVSYKYAYSHLWRNFGVLCAFTIFFMFLYLVTTEINSSSSSSAEALVYRFGHVPKSVQKGLRENSSKKLVEVGGETQQGQQIALPEQKDIYMWRDVCYDIQIKVEPRRLLDGISGWVKPGTLTALMGVSGAGKTTLLNVLAQRVSIGVITGDMLVNGAPLNASFQRKTGYVQQQDLHLHTSTVREALRFSALLRQPKSVSTKEKYDFVEDGKSFLMQ
jgi:ATP-binding cassette subfamily G (WHITE) protein 2 (PDR)